MNGVTYLKANAKSITFFAFLLALFLLSPLILSSNPGKYSISIVTPANGTNISGTYVLRAYSDQNVTVPAQMNVTFAFWNKTVGIWTNICTNATGVNSSPNGGNWSCAWNTLSTGMYETMINVTLWNSTVAVFNLTQNITIDNYAPYLIVYNSPSNNTNQSSGVGEFNFTVSDNVSLGGFSCILYLNGTANFTLNGVANGTETNITVALPVEESHVWNVTCSDPVGNTNFSTGNYTLTVDTVAPTNIGFISSTPANDTNLSQDNYHINVSFIDATTGAGTCTLELYNATYTNGQNFTMTNYNSTSCTFNVTSQTDYMTYFYAYVSDTAGNLGRSVARHMTIDTAAPNNLTLWSPANNTNTSSSVVEFNFTVEDTIFATGLSCSLYINYTVNTTIVGVVNDTETNITLWLADEDYNWNITCNDSAGNTNDSIGNYTLTVDTTAPANIGFMGLTPVNDTNQTTNNYFVNVSFTEIHLDTCLLEFYNATYTSGQNFTMVKYNSTSCMFNVTRQMTNYFEYFYVYVNDTAGNLNRSVARHVTFDNTSPDFLQMIDVPLNFTNTSNSTFPKINFVVHDNLYTTGLTCIFSINNTAADPTANSTIVGVANGTKTGIAVSSALNDGEYYWTIGCKDGADNELNSSEGLRTLIDTDAPDVGFTPPTPASNTNLSQDNFFVNITYNNTELTPSACWVDVWNTTTRRTVNYSMNMLIGGGSGSCYINMTGWRWSQGSDLWNYTVYMNDTANNLNSTVTRYIGIGVGTSISVVSPTLANNSVTKYNTFYVNASANFTINTARVDFWNTTSGAKINVSMAIVSTMDSAYVNITGIYDSIGIDWDNFTVYMNSTSIAAWTSTGVYNFRTDTANPSMTVVQNFTIRNDTDGYTGNYLEVWYNVTDNQTDSCWVYAYSYGISTPARVDGEYNASHENLTTKTCMVNVTSSDITSDGDFALRPYANDTADRNITALYNFSGVRTKLITGNWNLITNLNNDTHKAVNMTLNQLSSMTDNITYVAAYNNANKSWVTYRVGISSHSAYEVTSGQAVYMYTNKDVTLFRFNTTVNTTEGLNTTMWTGGWNLVGITLNTYTYNLTSTWKNINVTDDRNTMHSGVSTAYHGNVTYSSYHNATTDIYTSYRRGFTKNRYTFVPRGAGVWLLTNQNVTLEGGVVR